MKNKNFISLKNCFEAVYDYILPHNRLYDHIQRKQGLKQLMTTGRKWCDYTLRPYPAKTRIETFAPDFSDASKLLYDHIQRKQGLKHHTGSIPAHIAATLRPYPAKTRIETA